MITTIYSIKIAMKIDLCSSQTTHIFIAILNGVGASTARRRYDKGPGQWSRGRHLPRGRQPDQTAVVERAERNQRIHVLKKKGIQLEEISDILSWDSSTVKRNLKKRRRKREL